MDVAVAMRTAPMVAMLGAVTLFAIQQVAIGRSRRGHALHYWAAAWSALTVVFILGRVVQHAGQTMLAAEIGTRMQVAIAFLVGPVAIGLLRALEPTRATFRALVAVVCTSVGFSLLVVFTDLVIVGEGLLRVEVTGNQYYVMRPGPLLPPLLPYAAVVIGYCGYLGRQSQFGRPRVRRLLVTVAAVFFLSVINDLVSVTGLFHSIQILDVGFFITTFGFGYVAHQEAELRFVRLEEEASSRARQLEVQGARLERSREELEQSEAKFQLLSDSTVEGVAIHEGGRILHHNSALEQMLGRSLPSDGTGELMELWDSATAVLASRIVAGEAEGPVEVQVRQADGTTFPAELVGRKAEVAARSVGVVTLRDLTVQKQMESRLVFADRIATLGTMAAGVAHEINNPLSFISGNLDFLEQELGRIALAPERRGEVEVALADSREGCQRIHAIVRDLKMFSGDDTDEDQRADVARTVRSSRRIVHNEIRHRARYVEALGEVPEARISESKLGQVVLNLLVNAAQAIPAGQADAHRITVRTSMQGGRILIEVSDTGVGIPAEVHGRIFDPFFTTKQVGEGTGLGLSICHSIVTSVGGHISAESQPGQGSTFRLLLDPAPPRPVATPSTAPSEPKAPGKARILVVDDEKMVIRMVCRILEAYELIVARSGREALERCQVDRPDLVLCDLMMPEMGGHEVYRRLKQLDASLAERVVFMTGGAFTPETQEFMATVSTPLVEKPVTASELNGVVARVLAAHPRR